MLYLLQPFAPLSFVRMPAKVILDEIRSRPDADLSGLGWEPAERAPRHDDLRVALRHGVACRAGLVVDSGLLFQLDQADNLRDIGRQSDAAQAAIWSTSKLIDQVIPGHDERGQALNSAVAAQRQTQIRQFEAEAEALLAAPTIQQLADHWVQLGGRVPTPA